MRVAPVELHGVLAQIVYVDLVGINEESAARDLLLKRVRGERLKPTVSPHFPSGHATVDHVRRSIAVRPVYPAAAEDQQRFLQAPNALVRWRGLYNGKIDALRAAGELARKWSMEQPSQFDEEVARVISLEAKVAQDFRALPVEALVSACPYGLPVHPTVFSGFAIENVASTAKAFSTEARAKNERVNAMLVQLGEKPDLFMPRDYQFEMLARVLESAIGVARFNLETLPRGFLKPSSLAIPSNLTQYRILLMTRMDNDPRLHLVSLDPEIKVLGSFSASD